MKRLISIVFITLVMMLTACGGGGGDAGTNMIGGGSTTTTGTTTSTVTSELIYFFDKATLSNTGTDRVVLNVTTVNSFGNAIGGVPVSVRVDNGGVYTGGSVSDGTGVLTGFISSPGDKTNRLINVTISSGTAVKTSTISIVGSQITITPVPGSPVVSTATSLNLKLVDANSNGIRDVDLTISGTAGFSGIARTDINGNAIFNGVAPAAAGAYSITVAGSGVSTSRQIVVSAPGGGGIPDAVGPVGPPSLDAVPNNIRNNVTIASDNRSSVIFKIRNASNQGVPNVRVRFQILAPGLGAGERMSTGSTIVYTNAAGEVTSDYIAGTRSSPTDGVKIRACYGLTDSAVATCASFVDEDLTVTGQALNLSIFNNNTLQGRFSNTVYVQTLIIQVADSAGQPVSGAVISTSVDVTHYGKGAIWNARYLTPSSNIAPTRNDDYTTGLSPTLSPTSSLPPGTTTISGFNVWCINEDLNRNGTRDAGDDLDGDLVLEPRASDVVVSKPNGSITDSNGLLQIDVQWGQNVGGWLAYTVKASTNVDGSEGTNSRAFITNVLEGDVRNGSFLIPPYGVNNCQTNN